MLVNRAWAYRCGLSEGSLVDSAGDWVLGLSGRSTGDTRSVSSGTLPPGQSRSSDRGEVERRSTSGGVGAASSEVSVCWRSVEGIGGGVPASSEVLPASAVPLAGWWCVGSVSSSSDAQTGNSWASWTWRSSNHGDVNASEHWPHVTRDGCWQPPASDAPVMYSKQSFCLLYCIDFFDFCLTGQFSGLSNVRNWF